MNKELRAKARRGEWDYRFLSGHPDVAQVLHRYIMEAVARGLVVTSTTGDSPDTVLLLLDPSYLDAAEKHLTQLAGLDFSYRNVSERLDKIAQMRNKG